MADITDIRSIVYTEKSISLQESGVIVVETSPKVSKHQLRNIFNEFFGFNPIRINSLNQEGKVKKFKGVTGTRSNYKKFYVRVPEGANIESFKS